MIIPEELKKEIQQIEKYYKGIALTDWIKQKLTFELQAVFYKYPEFIFNIKQEGGIINVEARINTK